ncbi:hypothetical protein GMB86_11875 [Terrilactibacillus sp. BCM23-1]|uniref:Uncharacterized protein n=1 Tax=Terrilactibacillus tamarindi TaxID=2599694 RepID=A0A6N8CUG0_9BACI|nr:hypothetical protein [Terrilactibacillus tamarindi]MTT32705.1 hypothetical protein [Terrilactibacillus tamarindi]
MKKEYKDKCPSWAQDTMLEHCLILGDDSDSLLSCNLLEYITGGMWRINWFYDFETIYCHKKTGLPSIGVDMAFIKNIKTFDNHVSRMNKRSDYNKQCLNPNLLAGVTLSNYTQKYAMSTLLLIMSYYDVPLPKSQLGKELLLCIDVAFKGHYYDMFKNIHHEWLDRLGYAELIDVLNERNPQYFYNLITSYHLNDKVYIQDGQLHTDIDLNAISRHIGFPVWLPNDTFNKVQRFKRCGQSSCDDLPPREDIISLAYTSKKYISYTYARRD